MTTTRIDPFTADGVQAISWYTHGWMHYPNIVRFETAREARAWLDEQMRYWVRYSDISTVLWYGYDPIVYNEPDDITSGVLGTDGYPDYSATINLDDDNVDSINWEQDMILDQMPATMRKYGATNALVTNFDPFCNRMLRWRYKYARQSGCSAYAARGLLWESLWVTYLANGARDDGKIQFVSHLDRPRKVDA